MNDIEKIRLNYKPFQINLLFIGESAPRNGTFFYLKDSNLFSAVKKGFEKTVGPLENNDIFLEYFKNFGCYLDDLCLTPVNGFSEFKRLEYRINGIEPLSQRISVYKPLAIIILMKGIEQEVKEAIRKSSCSDLKFIKTTSFPIGEENIKHCINDVSKAVFEMLKIKME